MRLWDSRSVSGARALTQAWIAIGSASIVIAAAACHETGTSPPPTPRLHGMFIVSGNDQTGEVGTALTQPVVIKLTDSLGSPLAARVIHFYADVDAPGDSLLTDSLGIASDHWMLPR